MSNRTMLKEAIADAKTIKETAIANAKAALEESFTPHIKSMLSAKLQEMDKDEDLDEAKKDDSKDKVEEMDAPSYKRKGGESLESAPEKVGKSTVEEEMDDMDEAMRGGDDEMDEMMRGSAYEEDDTMREAEEVNELKVNIKKEKREMSVSNEELLDILNRIESKLERRKLKNPFKKKTLEELVKELGDVLKIDKVENGLSSNKYQIEIRDITNEVDGGSIFYVVNFNEGFLRNKIEIIMKLNASVI